MPDRRSSSSRMLTDAIVCRSTPCISIRMQTVLENPHLPCGHGRGQQRWVAGASASALRRKEKAATRHARASRSPPAQWPDVARCCRSTACCVRSRNKNRHRCSWGAFHEDHQRILVHNLAVRARVGRRRGGGTAGATASTGMARRRLVGAKLPAAPVPVGFGTAQQQSQQAAAFQDVISSRVVTSSIRPLVSSLSSLRCAIAIAGDASSDRFPVHGRAARAAAPPINLREPSILRIKLL